MSEEKQSVQEVRGERGEVGVATPSLTVKQRWHSEHFSLENTNDKKHPYRRTFRAKPGSPSLKAFARKLAASGDKDAQAWLENKQGFNKQQRSEANVAMASVCAQATKLARRKPKAGGGSK